MPPAEDSVGANSMAQFLRLVVRDVCFVILVSVTAIMSNTLFVHLTWVDGQGHQSFYLKSIH